MDTCKSPPRIFDRSYLDILLSKLNAILISCDTKLNSTKLITFNCFCGILTVKKFCDIAYYGGAYCKTCIKKNKIEKIKNTCMEKYGVENCSQSKEIKEKKEATYIEHYGMHPKKTKEVQERYKNTCLERYGVENSAQVKEIKEKIQQTFLDNYGGHPMLSQEIKDKVKNTCFEKYGGYPAESQEVKDKMNSTFLNKYGSHPSQTIEGLEKIIHSSKSYKKYRMPSGEERNVQGYEPKALDILLKIYKEEEIITERKNIPKIKYNYENKVKYYFPDIFIPHLNTIIEVKSDWTYQLDISKNTAKKDATIAAGYKYKIWCFNRKGIKIDI